ncbi:putative ubiquitin-like-specific protease 2B [Panicum miliaceum]|uniref:Ubiquitin-like-specific protease 2B n=1 Tax=Panicum miliaceum TaxID=4540 RepID=A0A3L6SV11_PANMI|nr:putative ubiquitin-like-specific protease 2B [Panicum miliaceum]
MGFLKEEWFHLKKNPSPNTKFDVLASIIKKIAKVPQQNNGYDSGIFMLYYIERFISEAPERFTEDKLCMFNESWFKPEDASELRHTIRQRMSELLPADTIN